MGWGSWNGNSRFSSLIAPWAEVGGEDSGDVAVFGDFEKGLVEGEAERAADAKGESEIHF